MTFCTKSRYLPHLDPQLSTTDTAPMDHPAPQLHLCLSFDVAWQDLSGGPNGKWCIVSLTWLCVLSSIGHRNHHRQVHAGNRWVTDVQVMGVTDYRPWWHCLASLLSICRYAECLGNCSGISSKQSRMFTRISLLGHLIICGRKMLSLGGNLSPQQH